ncbi:hypothetical protein PPERSA_00655 [Pseudocohnilembus persalinus]|uniref:Uncharacterized protein n=1 Tax=Pseudocohnilembus persalinus TaxID=266149 RepID=A0A0V0QTP2_PSEPJ|nr:hypothetical protein PPERSA_00655 [Pseudocohnilembus persalinus]|eukprot:KRX05354.1 hypothetical protein PPERSA_00655 [Pseudocohnilembus persalinus]
MRFILTEAEKDSNQLEKVLQFILKKNQNFIINDFENQLRFLKAKNTVISTLKSERNNYFSFNLKQQQQQTQVNEGNFYSNLGEQALKLIHKVPFAKYGYLNYMSLNLENQQKFQEIYSMLYEKGIRIIKDTDDFL